MMSYKKKSSSFLILFLSFFTFLGDIPQSVAIPCFWEKTKKAEGFEASVSIAIINDAEALLNKGERHKGKLIVAGPGVFVWIVREGMQRHLYHGDGKTLRYYTKAAHALRYMRKGEVQPLETVWVGYMDELFWQKSTGRTRFQIKHQPMLQGCQTTWVPVPGISPLPPFSTLTLLWDGAVVFPRPHRLRVAEVGGRQMQLHFEQFRWGTALPVSQLKDPSWVLVNLGK